MVEIHNTQTILEKNSIIAKLKSASAHLKVVNTKLKNANKKIKINIPSNYTFEVMSQYVVVAYTYDEETDKNSLLANWICAEHKGK